MKIINMKQLVKEHFQLKGVILNSLKTHPGDLETFKTNS